MLYRLDANYLFSTQPLGLHALKLRLALFCAHEKYVERARPAHGPQPAGFSINLAKFKSVLGMPNSNDARAIKAAIAILQSDPVFEQLSISSDGRKLHCILCNDLHNVAYFERFATLDLEEIAKPRTVAEFHLAMRWAQTRRMKAPAITLGSDAVATMARNSHSNLAWVRRTLLPAAKILASRLRIEIFIGATWSSGACCPPNLRLRFKIPGQHWKHPTFQKAHCGEHAWFIDKTSVKRLHKPTAQLIF